MKNGCIIDDLGNKLWYLNDMYHRTDGPAIEYVDGSKSWWLNDQLHRIDGPAVESTRTGYKAWYYHNKQIDCRSQSEFEQFLRLKAFW
jgi:hypothetical protein